MPPKKRRQAHTAHTNTPPPNLPDEVWSAIFVEVVHRAEDRLFYLPRPGNAARTENLCKALTRAPLTLTSVCVRWRAIALTTPQLWTIIMSPREQENAGPFYAHLPVQLARCGNRPRPLAIFDLGKLNLLDLSRVLSDLNALPCIRKFHMAVDYTILFNRLLGVSLPALEEISLECVGNPEKSHTMAQGQLVALLMRFSALRVMAILDIDISTSMYFHSVPLVEAVVMPKLEKITFIRIQGPSLERITKRIAAPQLETVQVQLAPENRIHNVSTLTIEPSYLAFSKRHLREIVVGGQVDNERLEELLRNATELRTLRIIYAKRRNFQFESSLATLLTVMDHHHQPAYVPHLEMLSYNKARIAKADLEEFVRFRTTITVPTLKKIQLTKTSLLGSYSSEIAAGSSEVLMGVEIELDVWQPDWE